MKKILCIILLFTALGAKAQGNYQIGGRVTDENGQTIPGATVFITNSKNATATNNSGSFTFSNMRPGTYEVVIRFIGFAPDVQNVSVRDKDVNIVVRLKASIATLKAVNIDGSSNRAKYMKLFIKNFMGEMANASQCKILNPEAISFSYNKKNAVLKASSDDMLLIENHALGYNIKYLMREFEVQLNTAICINSGSPYFEEMAGTAQQQKLWDKNRRKAYLGSARHFFRAIINGTAQKEGFVCYKIPANLNQEEFGKTPHVKQIDSLFLPDSNHNFKTMATPIVVMGNDTMRLSLYIIYLGPDAAERFYKRGYLGFDSSQNPASIINPQVDEITIDKNGGISPPKSFVTTYYWSKLRMANLTPMEYSAEAEQVKKL